MTERIRESSLEGEEPKVGREISIEELSIQTECREFVESHKETVLDGLGRLIKDNRFVLCGDYHSPEAEQIQCAIAESLSKLRDQGLKKVCLEVGYDKQEMIDGLNYNDPNIKDVLKKMELGVPKWFDGNYDILIAAKRAGLKVQFIDYPNKQLPGYGKDMALWSNSRDEKMFSIVKEDSEENDKTLIVIGSKHVYKNVVDKHGKGKGENRKYEEIKVLGTHLSEKYGSENVASIRLVLSSEPFDYIPGSKHYVPGLKVEPTKTPTPKELYEKQNEPVILPDGGPIKGEVAVADYIITII